MKRIPDITGLRKYAEILPGIQLKPHQQQFVDKLNNTDALLALHGTGTGKGLSSIAGAEATDNPAVVLTPAALRGNYRKDLKKFTNDPEKYQIASYERAAKGPGVVPPQPLFIADEVQRLRNQGKSYTGALDIASKADKRILLSATPLVNSPGDMASIINLLHGKQLYTPDQFEDRFVGEKMHYPFLGLFGKGRVVPTVKHKHELLKLLKNHVDYAGEITDTKPSVTTEDVPVEMSTTQDRLTRVMKNELPLWLRWRIKHNLPPNKQQATQLNAFLSGMRQVSLSPYGFDKRLEPYTAFKDSPKLVESFTRLQNELQNPQHKVAIYSNFIRSGLEPYAAALDKNNIPYVKFDGSMSDGAKKAAIDAYNNGKARVVLIGPAGAEGISLKGTTAFHALDPHWNQARDNQAQARAVRLDSHVHLPENMRNVNLLRFTSEPKRGILRKLLGMSAPVGSDEYLASRAKEKQDKLDKFIDVLREAGSNG